MITDSLRLLLVEDNPGDAHLIELTLAETKTQPFDLIRVATLAEGLARLAQQSTHLVLLDLSLPDSTGLETLRRLHDYVPAIPIVVLTNLDDELVARQALHEGAQDYLIKGQMDGPLLVRSMRYAIERAALYTALEHRVRERTQDLARANADLQFQIAERARAEAALHKHQETLQAIVTTSPDLILMLDLHGNIRFVNPASQEMLGYPPATLIEQNVCSFLHPDDRASARLLFTSVVREPMKNFQLRVRGQHADGHWVMIEGHGRVMLDTTDQSEAILVVGRNISAQVQMEQDLRQAKEEAERASRAKSEFLSRMSHELRTPLNAILGFAQLLEMSEREPLTQQQREGVEQILRGGRHLLDLVNEVLDLARIESGRLLLSIDPVPIAPLLREVYQLTLPLAAQRRLVCELDLTIEDTALIFADRQRLSQVLLNLLSNAVKYNREQGTIRLSVTTLGTERIRIAVHDTGPGILPEKQDLLFNPFERLGAEASPVHGTGLGLAISKRLIEAMGGSIGVESEVGSGSIFWIELPRVRGSTVEDEGDGVGGNAHETTHDPLCRGQPRQYRTPDAAGGRIWSLSPHHRDAGPVGA
ncbi:MAG: hypothetical protein KatS3mg057_0009 [Herpetosiphonaceae bacterium]|nr:MAG: hypothetical protein KatS3mg057_0009 [Herpetosiphonaceae bacterium]